MSGAERIVLKLFGDFVPEDHGTFAPFYPGVEILPLYGLTKQGEPLDRSQPSAALLRYAPGAAVPQHRHLAYEHIFIIEGSQSDSYGTYPRGSCVISGPGTSHAVASEQGCLVLAIWNQSVEVTGK
jgi:anti-sigma factor ChrR (cupin superfamily)